MNFRTALPCLASIALLSLVGLLTPAVSAQNPEAAAGTFNRSIDIGGIERTYRVHVPDAEAPASGMPVLVMLHGGGGNGAIVERTTGFSDLADQNGFIAVYPNGTGRSENMFTWDAHNCCAYAYREHIDDVGFISAMIDRLIADFNVDPTRIYVTGHSNGAMMTYRIGCELAVKIAAIAPVSGALNTSSCSPSRPLPVLIVHGEDDENVRVSGGPATTTQFGQRVTRIDEPLSYAVSTWVGIDGCARMPVAHESSAATTAMYNNCLDGTNVETMLIPGWAHGWPRTENGAPLNISPMIWVFVSQFSNAAASAPGVAD